MTRPITVDSSIPQPDPPASSGEDTRDQAPARKRVLFVDNEPKVLDGLKRMLHAHRHQWEMVFTGNGQQALELLNASDFDLLITDMRLPGMSGIELLTEVVKRHSQVIRFILSGSADQDVTLRSASLAHQYLVKPCSPELLRASIERALSFRILMDKPSLKRLVSSVNTLPGFPSSYSRLLRALQDSEVSAREIGSIIATDLAMSAKVLQLVNSSFFGLHRHIGNPADAVMFLGVDTVKALALTVVAFSQCGTTSRHCGEELRRHSFLVGLLARRLAAEMKLSKSDADDAFTGGLLHDLGKLVLSASYPDQYERALEFARREHVPEIEGECHVFGASHAAVGAYLLWLWGFPDPVIDVVVNHHGSGQELPTSGIPAILVRFANALIHRASESELTIEPFQRAGLLAELRRWQQMAEEMLMSEISNVEKSSLC